MEEIKFINKIWVSKDRKLLFKIIRILCLIYLILNIVIIMMEGFALYEVITIFISIIFIMWSNSNIKESGEYIDAECKINFSEDKIRWEYININLPKYKGATNIIYLIDRDKIKNISLSSEINSIRVECSPLVRYISDSKEKEFDYRIKNKSCVLIIYNYDLEKLKKLFTKYTDKEIEQID